MDRDLSSAQHVLSGIVSGVEHDAVGVGRAEFAIRHVDAEQVRASPVNGCSTEDAGRGPGVIARRRQELDRMHSHRLRRSMILVLLLTLHGVIRKDLGVPTEVGLVAVVRDDPAAVGDRRLAECRVRGRYPGLICIAERLSCVLHAVVIGVCESVNDIVAGE